MHREDQARWKVTISVSRTVTTVAIDHIDLLSAKGFDATVRDLAAELGIAGPHELMDRLVGAGE